MVPGRIRGAIPIASKVRDELETLLDARFFEGTPFDCIGVIIRIGGKTDLSPEYQPIEQGELPVAVELPMIRLSKANSDELAGIIKWALLETLVAIAEKYRLPSSRLLSERQKESVKQHAVSQSLVADEYLN